MAFVDKVRVFVAAGTGGNGCLSFLREKFRPFGGPDGGDGGRGGDVVFIPNPNLSTLVDFAYRRRLLAECGSNGKGTRKSGSAGKDLVVHVPLGTVVVRDGRVLADLSTPGVPWRAARGGRGGRGNYAFKSQRNTAPRICEKGEPGEEHELVLELKLIADVGLAGFPNAGKSTLLARVSNARPKIADYPFTTLSPNLGLVTHKERGFVMADIPGLIEGAHTGKGLGDEFLRHVERTRLLVHLVDPQGFGTSDALDGVRVIEAELKGYSPALAAKPRVLAVNKADLPGAKELYAKLKRRYPKRRIFLISAATGEGVKGLLDVLIADLARIPLTKPALRVEADEDADIVRLEKGFAVERLGEGAFGVSGPALERLTAMTDMTLEESVDRFQNILKRVGVEKALHRAGIKEGDTVRIGKTEFEWSEAKRAYKVYKGAGRKH
ncbi:MAG: GTPase ObgE [Elusimicrobiota bacterium]|jgi:GTP-binding protein